MHSAYEKLKRANENIVNLNAELVRFLSKGPGPVGDDENHERFFDLVDHSAREIDPRFSVLAGEILHHLRTALDHVVWHLTPEPRSNSIEFPVFSKRPTNNDEIASFKSKIKGISAAARTVIECEQPYHRPDPLEHSLWIIHDMDRIDKH